MRAASIPILRFDRLSPSAHLVKVVAGHLKALMPVVIPTETQYALACDATSRRAIDAVRTIKGRNPDAPFSIFLRGQLELKKWRIDCPEYAVRLADAFWPGPVTLILKSRNPVFKMLGGMAGSVGVRVTPEPLIVGLLDRLNIPLLATSANPSGRILAPSQENRWIAVEARAGHLVWARPNRYHRHPASTILDCTGRVPCELRAGPVSKEMWNAVASPYVKDLQRSKS